MTTTKRTLAIAALLAAGLIAYSGAPSADTPPVDAFGDPLPSGALARMGTVRFRHGDQVYSLAYSPDGRFLASGSEHGELRLWDAATGELVRSFMGVGVGGGPPVRAIAFSPDGELLALDMDRAGLWQVATGRRLRDLEFNGFVPMSLAFSPDGKEIVMGSDREHALYIFDPATGKCLRKITGHADAAVAAVYSKDGKTIASASKDKTARIWDAATGKELYRFTEPEPAADAALSPDGKLLAVKTAKAVHLWDVVTGKEVHRFEQGSGELRPLAFSPDGKTLGSDGVVWDVATGERLYKCEGGLIGDMAFSPNGKTIAAGGYTGVVYLCDSADGKELPSSRAGWNRGMASVAGFTPDGKCLALYAASGVRLCETATGKVIRQYAMGGERPCALALSPDGKTLAGVEAVGAITLWETATGKRLFRLESKDRRFNGSDTLAFAFAPDGRTLAAATGENVIRLWDAATGKELRQFRGHTSIVDALFFIRDGHTLVSTSFRDGTTRFWDAADGKEREDRLKQTGSVCAVSPDGQIVAVRDGVSSRGDYYLQEVATGKEIWRTTKIYLSACAFSSDGKTLAAEDNVAYAPDYTTPTLLLEVATGKVRAKLPGRRRVGPASMVFSPDGRMLALSGWDTTAVVYDATGRMRGGRFETAVLSSKELSDSWAALASPDAAEAYRAIWALTAAPAQALPLLKAQLKRLSDPDPKETARRIADLDSDDFNVREKAEQELAELNDLVEPALHKTLDGGPSAELRQRVVHLLEELNGPRALRKARSLEVLERIGTPDAEKILKEVAGGAPEARVTREATASLERLSRRPPP
jgi:WD40 repeat protein